MKEVLSMPQTTTINVSIDEDVKRDVETLLDKLGLTMGVAVNLFFKQILMDKALPFQPETQRKHIPLKERLKDFSGEYVFEEWDTGVDVGREIIE